MSTDLSTVMATVRELALQAERRGDWTITLTPLEFRTLVLDAYEHSSGDFKATARLALLRGYPEPDFMLCGCRIIIASDVFRSADSGRAPADAGEGE